MVLAFLSNVGLLIYLSRQYDFSVFKKLIKVKFTFKYVFLMLFMFVVFMVSLFMGYSFTLTRQTDSCTSRSLCGLYTDNMFVHSSVALYMAFYLVGMLAYVIIYARRFNQNLCKVKVEV